MILAPKNGVSVWEDEFPKWCPFEISCQVVVVRPGQVNGWQIVTDFVKPTNPSKVLVMSYESFQKYNSSYNDGVASYQPNSVDLVICDEANVLKNDATNRVKNLITFKAPKVWMGFTGTPYQNNVAERCNFVRFFRRGTPLDVPSYQAQHCR